jgi:hypothetical protein
MLKENHVRKGFFEREQFEAVRQPLPKELRGLVTFFYINGLRLSEGDLQVAPVNLDQVAL